MNDATAMALDPESKLAVTFADCTAAAAELARCHLSGPAAAHYLAEALAGAALLGAETSQTAETVTFRMDCPGQLEGFLVECTEKGTLRGYTRRKILNDFDGMGAPKDDKVLGASATCEIIRSIPGALLSSGAVAFAAPRRGAIAAGLNAYFAQSLQRRVRVELAAAVADDGAVHFARGVMVECPPDGDAAAFGAVAEHFASGAARRAIAGKTFTPRTILKKLGLANAQMRGGKDLAFACRCSAERAQAMLAALPEAERAALPESGVDITCHMCGRTWTVRP